MLARSIVADTTEGLATAKLMGVMMMINGFAPVLAPLFGGWVLSWGSWRDIFHVLGVITAMMMLGVIFVIKGRPCRWSYQGTALSVYSESAEGLQDSPLPGFHVDDVLCVWCAVLVHFRFDVCVAEDSGLVRD